MRFAFFALIPFLCFTQSKAINKGYLPDSIPEKPENLVKTFCDDFNENKLDTLAWGRYDRGNDAPWSAYICDSINNLIEVSDGSLKVRATWDNEKKHPWTGCVQTRHKKYLRYGRVDVRARFNRDGKGAWPAIWMLPQNPIYNQWPAGGEIDIMERINTEKQMHQAFHQADSSNIRVDLIKRKDFITPIDTKAYHVYSMVKLPNEIGLYVDYKLRAVHYPKAIKGAEKYWPFETEFYLILNHACSDMGQFKKPFWSSIITKKDLKKDLFPYEMEIDYVYFYDYGKQAN